MRGVVLPRLFHANGFRVLAPPLRECGPGRLQFLHSDVADYLARRGCPEILQVNTAYCVRAGARGDVDFAAVRGDVLLVAEVKTRLLVKYFGRDYLRDMLVYHLAEPLLAREAWDRLEQRGVVRRPPCKGRGGQGYDNPASIAELARSAVGFCLRMPDACSNIRVMVVSVITACYARPLLDVLMEAVGSTSGYLQRCLGVRIEPAVMVVHPDPGVFTGGSLHRVSLECIGEGCSAIGGLEGVEEPLRGCEAYCRPCSGCRYLRVCGRVCGEEG